MAREIEQVVDGDDVLLHPNGTSIICCHCGLTHTYKPVLKRTRKGHEVYVRIIVDDQETLNVRRRKSLWHDPGRLRGLARNVKRLPPPTQK